MHYSVFLQSAARERLSRYNTSDLLTTIHAVDSNKNVHLLNLDVFDKLIVFRVATRQGTSTEVGNYG